MNIVSDSDRILAYDANRYAGLSLDQIVAALRGATLSLLKRGTLSALIARREWGGQLVAATKLLNSYREQVSLFRHILDLDYSEARRHMKVWACWPRIAKMLRDREESCHRRGVPFIVPGYRRCLAMAGITNRSGPATRHGPPAPPLEREPLPQDVERLTEMVETLEQQNRMEREAKVRLTVQLDLARDEIVELTFNAQRECGDIGSGIIDNFPGPLRRLPPTRLERLGDVEVRTGDCLTLIEPEANVYDAIVTDPPYSTGLHGYEWDCDISFSRALWDRFMTVAKPGAYVAFFTAPRLYHRAAQAAEDAGFAVQPFIAWRFHGGLPKPANLSELFDRENLEEREVVGWRRGSGFTQANVDHGAQNRTHTMFPARARHVSQEAQDWAGFYYGRNALKPCLEPILLVQKPIVGRMVDNIRQWGTGCLNIGALRDQYGFWPGTLLMHRKANRAEHHSNHPAVKPVSLMRDVCTLVCPPGGRILDPFCGTGTTGVAARQRGFDCVLIEQDATMRPVIEERLRAA